jgi:hypothetical protein
VYKHGVWNSLAACLQIGRDAARDGSSHRQLHRVWIVLLCTNTPYDPAILDRPDKRAAHMTSSMATTNIVHGHGAMTGWPSPPFDCIAATVERQDDGRRKRTSNRKLCVFVFCLPRDSPPFGEEFPGRLCAVGGELRVVNEMMSRSQSVGECTASFQFPFLRRFISTSANEHLRYHTPDPSHVRLCCFLSLSTLHIVTMYSVLTRINYCFFLPPPSTLHHHHHHHHHHYCTYQHETTLTN